MTQQSSRTAWWRVPLALGLACIGCIPEQAGYAEVQSLSSGLAHVRANWNTTADGPSDEDLRELLKDPLTWERSVQLAIWLSPTVESAFVDLGLSRAELLRAYRPANPSADVALRFGNGGPTIELHALEELTTLLLLPFRASIAETSAQAARLQAVERVVNHLYTIAAYYVEYVAAENLHAQEALLRDAAQATAEAARSLFTAGNLTELALFRELAQQEAAELELNQATSDVAAKRQVFAEAVGLWRTDLTWSVPVTLGGALPPMNRPQLEQLEQQALTASLRLQTIHLRYESAAKTANLNAVRGWLPQVAAGVSAEHDDAGWSLGPAAAISLPLFDQGQGNVAESLTRALQQRQLAVETAARIRSQSRAVAVRFLAADKAASRIEQTLLPLHEKLVGATLLESNAMLAGVFQLLQAKREQLEAQKLRVRTLREYWLGYWQVRHLVAGGLPGSEPQSQASTDTGGSSRRTEASTAH